MEAPVIRPDNLHHHTDHHRRKISPIYKWLGLTHHGRVRRKEIRALRIGLWVGLVTSLLTTLLLIWSAHKSSTTFTTDSTAIIPGTKSPLPYRR